MQIHYYVRVKIEEVLKRFPFVMWDRFTYDPNEDVFDLYGWIRRKGDRYRKDFLLVRFDGTTMEWGVTTSSLEKHDEIIKILGLKEGGYNNCQRVEWDFDIKNVIKLK